MDGQASEDVLWKSKLLAGLDLDRSNESARIIESSQDEYSVASPRPRSSFNSPLPTPGSLAGVCDGSYLEDAHSHFERATHTGSPLSTTQDRPIEALDPHNDELSGQHLLASLTGTDDEARRAGLICTIEAFVRYLIEDLVSNATSIYVTVKARVRSQEDSTTVPHESTPPIVTSRPSFPGSTIQKAWRFTVVVRILQLIHEALVNNVFTTKRDMYYKDPILFRNQTTVDRYVDHLAFTFGVRRASLNVIAAAKGLVAGNLTIRRPNGTVLDASFEPQGMLVPHIHELDSIDISDSSWILVIEKEATFQSLASTRFYHNETIGNGVILTVNLCPGNVVVYTADETQAKGYPDLSTRALLHHISISHKPYSSPTPIFALVDFDPDGIAIMSTYKYGSIALEHENEALNVRSVQWLGLKSSDLETQRETDNDSGLLRLTDRDRRLVTKMLQRAIFGEGMEIEWRRELQTMLMLNMKAEIQLLSERPGGIEGWLEKKLSIPP